MLRIFNVSNRAKYGTAVFIMIVILVLILFLTSKVNSPQKSASSALRPETGIPTRVIVSSQSASIQETEKVPRTICGSQPEVTLLLIGIDYRRDDYYAGLADVIRVAQIDFSIPSVNVIALPRDLLVTLPEESFDVDGPIKLGQAYFFGTPSGEHFSGEDGGAGALSEVIVRNFGISSDNYLVLDFAAFRKFINAIGGIEVNLPASITDGSHYFPKGEQLLTGREALIVARARKNYGEEFRINNQTIIMEAIFDRLKEPETLFRMPALLIEFRKAVQMNFSTVQIYIAFSLLRNQKKENIHYLTPPEELIQADREYLPTIDSESFVWRWDQGLQEWIEQSMNSNPANGDE